MSSGSIVTFLKFHYSLNASGITTSLFHPLLCRQTKFHSSWCRDPPLPVMALVSGHPCSGAVAMSDVRLRLSHTIHNTEGGKKVSAAVSSTGRAVAGGLGAAKGAISSWWGGLKTEKASSPSVSEEPSPDAEVEEAREQKQSKD